MGNTDIAEQDASGHDPPPLGRLTARSPRPLPHRRQQLGPSKSAAPTSTSTSPPSTPSAPAPSASTTRRSTGSVIGVSDGTGLLEGYSYSAYGEVTFRNPDGIPRSDSALGTRFLYHGQLFDPWTRTYSMRAREYRPTWGRFLSTDPIGLEGGLNLYAFVDGRTLHFRDPRGTMPTPPDSGPLPADLDKPSGITLDEVLSLDEPSPPDSPLPADLD